MDCQRRLTDNRVVLVCQRHDFFKAPSSAEIEAYYGVLWLGFDRQKQTLNDIDYKKLEGGLGSLGYARMQVQASTTTDVMYDVYGGGIAVSSPEFPF